jgi:hypothetical protein
LKRFKIEVLEEASIEASKAFINRLSASVFCELVDENAKTLEDLRKISGYSIVFGFGCALGVVGSTAGFVFSAKEKNKICQTVYYNVGSFWHRCWLLHL